MTPVLAAVGITGAGASGAGLGVGVMVPFFLTMQDAVDLVLSGCQHAIRITLKHIHWPDAAQEAVHRSEPDSDVPVLEIVSETLENGRESLQRTVSGVGVKRISRIIVIPLLADGENLSIALPLVGLGTGVLATESRKFGELRGG